jgi:thiamine pyrophosphate-dependent acetolactate synthase large subunit-like protein
MDGKQALRIIAENQTEQVVVTTMSTTREWPADAKRPDLHLPLIGCMGKASSLGLGVALGAPDRQVLVLDGEGSLLMNLGSLVTIASQAPKNLIHFLFDNASYDTSGGQPTPGGEAVDFTGLALRAGYRAGYSIEDLEELRRKLPEILGQDGPTFVTLRVEKGWARDEAPSRKTAQAMKEVAAALAAR